MHNGAHISLGLKGEGICKAAKWPRANSNPPLLSSPMSLLPSPPCPPPSHLYWWLPPLGPAPSQPSPTSSTAGESSPLNSPSCACSCYPRSPSCSCSCSFSCSCPCSFVTGVISAGELPTARLTATQSLSCAGYKTNFWQHHLQLYRCLELVDSLKTL